MWYKFGFSENTPPPQLGTAEYLDISVDARKYEEYTGSLGVTGRESTNTEYHSPFVFLNYLTGHMYR